MRDVGILTGTHVALVPLTAAHLPRLTEIGCDAALWEWTTDPVTTPELMARYVETALAERAAGSAYPFVTVSRATETIVGTTRYANIVPAHRRLEIGWTWIAAPWQRTVVNTEAKFLMLQYVFETLRYHRVELKTDALNARSRAAMERLGARFEGTLRKHMVCASGRLRDTVYYSITDDEWPAVKSGLSARLAR